MTSTTRHICLIVLLGIFLGHTSIAVHAATHVASDVGECEFCIAYGDSVDAAEAVHEQGALDGGCGHWSDNLAAVPETTHRPSFRPRGPPSID